MEAAKKSLLEAYLFNGDDELKTKAMLDTLAERIAALGDITFNQQIFVGGELSTPELLLNALNTLPFASPLRLVVLREVDAAPKQIQEALVDYLKHPAETTVLAMSATSLAKNTRLYKAIAAFGDKAIVDCSTMKRSELPALVMKLAAAHGVLIDRDSSDALIERVGTSTVALDNELKKLAAIAQAAGQTRIERRDVQQHVQHMVEPKPWDLTDALALRDGAACLQLLGRIRTLTPAGSVEIAYTRLYAQCLTKLRELLTIKCLKQRGVSDIAGALKRSEWQLRTAFKGAGLYTGKELVNILRCAPETEQRMKSRPDAGREFGQWLMKVCRKA